MSLRHRDSHARDRRLLALRPSVAAATRAAMPNAGSAATLDAVDEALAQLVEAGAHRLDTNEAKCLWIKIAKRRLIDEHRSAYARYRSAIALEDQGAALAVGVGDDETEAAEERDWFGVHEIISCLRGEQRTWAHAWHHRVLHTAIKPAAQPRGIADQLGWTQEHTEYVANAARKTMAAHVARRHSGEVCAEQRELLDRVAASGHELPTHEEHFATTVFHVAGCAGCYVVWRTRRRSVLGRAGALVVVPYDAMLAAVQAITTGAHGQLARVGIGGGAVAGTSASLGAKTAAVCAGLACLAGAGELSGALPTIAPQSLLGAPEQTIRIAPAGPARAPVARATPATPAPPSAARRSTRTSRRSSSTSRRTVSATRTSRASAPPPPPPVPPPPAAAATPRFTPGDLPPAASRQSSSTPPPPPPAASQPTCTPGDLGC